MPQSSQTANALRDLASKLQPAGRFDFTAHRRQEPPPALSSQTTKDLKKLQAGHNIGPAGPAGSAAKRPIRQQSPAQHALVRQSRAEQAPAQQEPAQQPSSKDATMQKPLVEKQSMRDPPIQKPPTQTPAVEKQAVHKPARQEPLVQKLRTQDQSAQDPSSQESPIRQLEAEFRSAYDSPVQQLQTSPSRVPLQDLSPNRALDLASSRRLPSRSLKAQATKSSIRRRSRSPEADYHRSRSPLGDRHRPRSPQVDRYRPRSPQVNQQSSPLPPRQKQNSDIIGSTSQPLSSNARHPPKAQTTSGSRRSNALQEQGDSVVLGKGEYVENKIRSGHGTDERLSSRNMIEGDGQYAHVSEGMESSSDCSDSEMLHTGMGTIGILLAIEILCPQGGILEQR